MTLQESVKITGHLPSKFEMADGKFELFTRKQTGNKGYIVSYWEMIDGVQDTMLLHATGKTIDIAKNNLKTIILTNR